MISAGSFLAVAFGVFFFRATLPDNEDGSIASMRDVKADTIDSLSSHSLMPLVSNQWYSNVFFNFPTSPLYAMPLAVKMSPAGLSFSYPSVKATANTIVAPFSEDFTVGFGEDFQKPMVIGEGDWTFTTHMQTNSNKGMSFTLGHGIPYTNILVQGENVTLTFPHDFQISGDGTPVSSGNQNTDTLVVTTNNNTYLLYVSQKTVIQISQHTIIIPRTTRLTIALLDKKEHVSLFKDISHVDITDSEFSPQIDPDTITTTYQLTTSGGTPLITLYPHQMDFLSGKVDVLGSYQTLRGELKLIKADSFTLKIPLTMPGVAFPKPSKDIPGEIDQIKKDTTDVISQKAPDSQDYYLGTWFGKVTNLILLADTFGLDDEKHRLIEFAEPIFIKSLDGFYYDKKKTSIIASKPEFGNEALNDHHFHYGYYIRTAAVLSSFDLSFLPKVKKQIDAMASDIATVERSSDMYPFLRNFDVYEGHSWADGDGAADDGNNQESTSEAINAWYSVYLWGKINNDVNLQKYALFIYTSEIQSAYYYWFDIKNMYQRPYTHAIGTIVWGGKVDFATWFSDEANMKYGIELLPFTPASAYLGKLSSFDKYQKDFLANGSLSKDWGDLYVMWESFYDSRKAMKDKDSITKYESNNTKSMFLYELYSNKFTEDLSVPPSPTP